MASKTYIENVAVVGAGGRMGSYIVEALVKEGKHKITVLTRPDSDSKMPDGVTIKKVDYAVVDSITEALKGQDALIITMSAMAPPDQSLQLVEAAARANIKHIMPNSYGVDGKNTKLFEESLLAGRFYPVQQKIEELGVSSWYALSCSFWYEWSLSGTPMGMGPKMYGFDLKNKSVTFFDDGETKINTSIWPQAGLAVARLFALDIATLEQFKNNFVYVSSFLLSQKDMLQSVLRVQGSKEGDWKINYEPSKQRYEDGLKALQGGDPSQFAKVLYSRGFYPGDGNFEKDHELANKLLKLPEEDLDQATIAAFKYGEVAI